MSSPEGPDALEDGDFVRVDNNEGFEIEDALEIAPWRYRANTECGWQALERTKRANRAKQFDMAETVRGGLWTK